MKIGKGRVSLIGAIAALLVIIAIILLLSLQTTWAGKLSTCLLSGATGYIWADQALD